MSLDIPDTADPDAASPPRSSAGLALLFPWLALLGALSLIVVRRASLVLSAPHGAWWGLDVAGLPWLLWLAGLTATLLARSALQGLPRVTTWAAFTLTGGLLLAPQLGSVRTALLLADHKADGGRGATWGLVTSPLDGLDDPVAGPALLADPAIFEDLLTEARERLWPAFEADPPEQRPGEVDRGPRLALLIAIGAASRDGGLPALMDELAPKHQRRLLFDLLHAEARSLLIHELRGLIATAGLEGAASYRVGAIAGAEAQRRARALDIPSLSAHERARLAFLASQHLGLLDDAGVDQLLDALGSDAEAKSSRRVLELLRRMRDAAGQEALSVEVAVAGDKDGRLILLGETLRALVTLAGIKIMPRLRKTDRADIVLEAKATSVEAGESARGQVLIWSEPRQAFEPAEGPPQPWQRSVVIDARDYSLTITPGGARTLKEQLEVWRSGLKRSRISPAREAELAARWPDRAVPIAPEQVDGWLLGINDLWLIEGSRFLAPRR